MNKFRSRLLPALLVTYITSAMLFSAACSTQSPTTAERISNLTSDTITEVGISSLYKNTDKADYKKCFEQYSGFAIVLCSCPAVIVDSDLHSIIYHDTIVEIVGKDTERFLIKWPGGKQAIINKSLVSVSA